MANLPADRTVWLGGLPSWLSSEDLYSWASSTTWPVFCEVAWSMHSLTHGYCIYSTAEEAQEAVQQLPTGVAGYRVSKRPWKGKGDSKGAKAAAPGPAPGPAEAAAKAAAPAPAPAGPAEAAPEGEPPAAAQQPTSPATEDRPAALAGPAS